MPFKRTEEPVLYVQSIEYVYDPIFEKEWKMFYMGLVEREIRKLIENQEQEFF